MQTIICPNCQKRFEIDDTGYAAIVAQVRGLEFDRELTLVKQQYQEMRERQIRELQDQHAEEMKKMEEAIERYRDFKIRLDNKSLGESLEQYCLHEFDNIRGLLSGNVEFGKDNDAKKGETKGDFIYRETDDDGVEILSIMFEMKTEFDDSASKKRNTDHLPKLDRDRAAKGCEYAVLVTMLEPDNEYYNKGIVKAPGAFDKMYVVRPQCFLTIISILRSAALNTLEYKRTIAALKREQADVTTFEAALDDFKEGFAKTVEGAASNFNDAIDELNRAIQILETIRDGLLEKCGKKLNTAVRKVDGLTIKKLTRNAPTVRVLFEEARGEE